MLKSDMFSVDVLKNSFMAMMTSSSGHFDVMKVSSPVARPLHPPSEANSRQIDREEL